MKKWTFIVSMLFVSNVVFACSCLTLKKLKRQDIGKTEIVFVGTVQEVVQIDKYRIKAKFLIEEGLLNVGGLKEYEIWAGRDCEPDFIVGKRWYIFATLYDNKHWSGLCNRSAELSERVIENEVPRYRRQAQRYFDRSQARANREIRFIKNLKQ